MKDDLVSCEAVIKVLVARWITTERNKLTMKLESKFRGGMTEILDNIRDLPREEQHGKEG